MLLTPEQRDEFELNEAKRAAKSFGFDNTVALPGTGYTEARQRVHEAVDYFRSQSNGTIDPTPNEAQAVVQMFQQFGVGADGRAVIDTATKYQVLLR